MRATSVSVRLRSKLSPEHRDQIVLDHLSLVKAIAIRVHENLPVHVDLDDRSEEHTSELQSPCNLVCRLLLEKKQHKTLVVVYASDASFTRNEHHHAQCT